jgi:hypothetical protein
MATEAQRIKARAVMAELRKKYPDRFNPKKNGAAEKWLAKAKARADLKAQVAAQLESRSTVPPSAPEIPPVEKPLVETPAKPRETPAPNVGHGMSNPATSPARPDTALFSESVPPPQMKPENPDPNPQPAPGATPPGENFNPPPPGAENAAPPGSPPGGMAPTQDTRKMAVAVWMMILNFLIAIFGEAMVPRRLETSPGQFYDENESMVNAWADYLLSLGLAPLTPLANLLLAHAAYLLPRLTVIVEKVKGWFKKKVPVGSRGPAAPEAPTKPTPEKPSEKPEATPPPAPATPGAQPKPEVPDNELGDS